MNEIIENMKVLAEKYGFEVGKTNEGVNLICKDMNGNNVNWIMYNQRDEMIQIVGNTDNCNLWFHITRPDMTPERIIQFVEDLNIALEVVLPLQIKDLIDPEDWQEIAGVCDAHKDRRYTEYNL